MTIDTVARVQRSFRRSFHSYHDSATQQARIAQLLARRLRRCGAPPHFAKVFEVGCGTGHLTEALVDRFSIGALTLNDLVPEAVVTAQRVQARFVPGDARFIEWPENPDLVASASTLQWMDAPEVFVHRAARALAPGGWLAISGYGPAQFQELAALDSVVPAPGLCRPRLLADALSSTAAGQFDIVESRERICRLWFETPLDALRHLRQTGVNATASRTWTKACFTRFCDAYIRSFGQGNRVPLTYHPVWIIARRRC